MDSNTNNMHSIKKEIMHCIEKSNGAFYGDIVRELRYPNYTVLKHIIELKERGLVEKDNEGGKYQLIRNGKTVKTS